MLHEPDRHEPLTSAKWDEAKVNRCIETILRDAIAHYSPQELWPPHPLETFSPANRWNLYVGAAGMVWGLNHLAVTSPSIDLPPFADILSDLFEPNRAWIGEVKGKDASVGTKGLLAGDAGILLVQARLGGAASVADALGAAIDANRDNAALELMWGSPGTALASLWLHEWTGEEVWADRFRRDVGLLWDRMEHYAPADCYLWTQNFYGHEALHLGAAHGFAGNAYTVIRGWHLLESSERIRWARRLAETLRRTALREDDRANWPQSVGKHRPGRTAMLVQHCHGAPGMVNCFAGFPADDIDDLLVAAGEMIWHAGPLSKGSGLCHGTSGNGFAFLKLFRRTGDERWLERARRFAMHAIEQEERDARTYGRRRYTLWTGDVGLAIYLSNCIAATDRFPTMDTV